MFSLSEAVSTPTHAAPSSEMSLINLALISNPKLLLHCYTIPTFETAEMCSYHN